jgi:H+/Cl- antiporter ClcA
MTALWLTIIGYIVGVVATPLYDALVGFSDGDGGEVEFNGKDTPPLFLAALFWPIVIVFIIVYALLDFLKLLKSNRKTRQASKK